MSLLHQDLHTRHCDPVGPAVRPRPTTSTHLVADPREWMGLLDPSLHLDELTIPGTHNSGARHGGMWGTCQDRSIREQLSAGVRYLDVRVRHHRGDFHIHHQHWAQRLRLDEVLDVCRGFLTSHPTESVLVCLTQEFSRDEPRRLDRTWRAVQRNFPGLLHQPTPGSARSGPLARHSAREVPTLAQARGRLVVVSRTPGLHGLAHSSWRVHDDWHIGTRQLWFLRKWPGVQAHLRAARAARGDDTMWSLHATSNGWSLPPIQAARLLEPALIRHLDELGPPHGPAPERNGVVLLDFPSDEQLAQLVGRNL